MWSPETVLWIAAVFVLAGLVKGVIGLGLPTLSLALLTATVGLEQAIALMLAPSLVTNVMQAATGGHLRPILRRLRHLLLAACVAILVTASALTRIDAVWLSALLGLTLLAYATVGLSAARMPSPGRAEPWLSPLVGTVNGALTGLTGSFVVPGTLYLQSLGLARDPLVQSMGVLYTVSTAALAVALGRNGLLGAHTGALSALACLPALGGMALGARIRRRLPEGTFRTVFFVSLLVLGAWIVVRSALSR